MPQKLRCEVTRILDHGERVYSVFLKPETPAPRFQAGQFLHLALDEYRHGDFWPESRVFSIASPPSDRLLLRISYAVKGQFTGRMAADLRPGREVWIKMPYGEFVVDSEKDVCLLAGGTGVTAFTAFLSSLGADHLHAISLFYGARRPDLLIYRPQVESAAAGCPNLRPFFLVEENPGPGDIPGRIDLDAIWEHLPDPLAVNYYMAGPPDMMNALAPALRRRGVADDKVIMDAWE